MTKVICPACGLVNLDKFVTYPDCAGCGSRLPVVAGQSEGVVWRRPLRAFWWATIVGVGCAAAALTAVGVSRETMRKEDGHLVIYTQVPRQVVVGSEFGTQYRFDNIEENGAEVYSEVRFRLSRAVLQDFDLISADPLPRQVFDTNGGRYLLYPEMDRDTPLRLTLKARRTGDFRLNAQIYSRDFYPFETRNFVTVLQYLPRRSPKAPGHRPPRTKP